MKERTINLLIVDDDESDQDMIADILDDCCTKINVATLNDGSDVMDYLCRKGSYKHAVTPDLILLDLNMPLKDGRQVLAEIKNNPGTTHIPVVILTTSENQEDICDTYRKGANAYVRKQAGLASFTHCIQQLEQFWINTVVLPTACGSQSVPE